MNISDYLSAEERQALTRKSDLRGFAVLGITWLSILAVFALVTTWTNPLTLLLGVVLLAGRQLGLAVIMHDCGHNTLFRTRAFNRFFGQWFAANVVLQDMPSYAAGHNHHHRLAGSAEDPDLPNYRAYPVSRESFRRKLRRDLTGQTGYKLLRFVLQQAAGFLHRDTRRRALPFVQELLVNALFALFLGVVFAPWAYLLWVAAYLTVYMAVVRIRQVAEHAAVPDLYDRDPRNNTRTTIPHWWERLLFAPNYVNYHLEHHLMASVPCYRLPSLHKILKSRGAYAATPIFHGYREVLRHTVRPAAAH
jgi:fatty acid desaturase